MISSRARRRMMSAVGLAGAIVSLGCDRGSPARPADEAVASVSPSTVASGTGQYNPAITVYKNPT